MNLKEFIRFETKGDRTVLKVESNLGETVTVAEIIEKDGKFTLLTHRDSTAEYGNLYRAKLGAIERPAWFSRVFRDNLKWHGLDNAYERCLFCGYEAKINKEGPGQ